MNDLISGWFGFCSSELFCVSSNGLIDKGRKE